MNKKMINKTGLFLFFSTCLIAGCDKPIQGFVNQRVALASGVDFDTAKLVVLNPDNGKEVQPCIQAGASKPDYQYVERKKQIAAPDMNYGRLKCKTELIINGTNSAIISALEISKEPIKGKIKKNGEVIDATFVITVTASYSGSHCDTTSSGGNQTEHCGQLHPPRPH